MKALYSLKLCYDVNFRDWRGLAELSGVTSETISFLESKEDPVAELIKIWCQTQDSGCRHFSDLKAFLAVIDRFDVADDIAPLLGLLVIYLKSVLIKTSYKIYFNDYILYIESDEVLYREKVGTGSLRDSSVSSLDASLDRNILTIGTNKIRYLRFILFLHNVKTFLFLTKNYTLK